MRTVLNVEGLKTEAMKGVILSNTVSSVMEGKIKRFVNKGTEFYGSAEVAEYLKPRGVKVTPWAPVGTKGVPQWVTDAIKAKTDTELALVRSTGMAKGPIHFVVAEDSVLMSTIENIKSPKEYTAELEQDNGGITSTMNTATQHGRPVFTNNLQVENFINSIDNHGDQVTQDTYTRVVETCEQRVWYTRELYSTKEEELFRMFKEQAVRTSVNA